MVSRPRHPVTGLSGVDAGLGERAQAHLAAEAHSTANDRP